MWLLKSKVSVKEFVRQALYQKNNSDSLTSCVKIPVSILKERVSRPGDQTRLNPFPCVDRIQEIPLHS